ncbi:hmg-20 [Pristionchus pacificus]|uniref:HMG box domain-containing protein n=1 Tax=Pristionchus pacificus TaxID=54126 RepID=A0A8R1V6L1_PRIPA|nr:hmg-20 [Pristionchus pacificus]
MDESAEYSHHKEDSSSFSILQSGSGGPRRRYHRKDAKKKKIEDPNAPRRPRSAYVHFLSSQRAKYGSAKGGVNQREINEMLAAEWRALNDTERQVFIVKSNVEKEEYVKLMESYIKTDEYKSFNVKLAEIKKKKKRGEHYDDDDEDAKVPSKHKKHGKHGKKIDFDCTPKEQGIFSEEFVMYNKEQEQSLRNLRRQIGQTEDELNSLKRNSHNLDVNSEQLKDLIKKDRMEVDRLEDTVSSWLDIVKDCLEEHDLENEEVRCLDTIVSGTNSQLEAYLEDLLDNSNDNKEIMDKLAKSLSHILFVAHQ